MKIRIERRFRSTLNVLNNLTMKYRGSLGSILIEPSTSFSSGKNKAKPKPSKKPIKTLIKIDNTKLKPRWLK